MACFTCIGCGTEVTGICRPEDWHTLVVEVSDVRSARSTSKIRILHFCSPCKPVGERFADAMCAHEVTRDLVDTFDEMPPLALTAAAAR